MNRIRAQEPSSGGVNPAAPGGVYIMGGVSEPVGYLTTLVLIPNNTQLLDYT